MKRDNLVDAVICAESIKAALEQKIINVYSPEITAIQALILLSIKKTPSISMGDIQNLFNTKQQTVGKHFSNLKKSELISFSENSLDLRKKTITLEPAAIELLNSRESVLESEAENIMDINEIMRGLKNIESLLNKRLEKQKKNKK